MAGLLTSPCVRKQDYHTKLLSHDGWSGDTATGHRGLPAKEKKAYAEWHGYKYEHVFDKIEGKYTWKK